MNALAGSVGLIPMIDDRLWAVEGGNVRLVQGAVNASGAELLTSHRVTAIHYDGRSSVYSVAGEGWERQFDIVVVAVPLEQAEIDVRLKDKLPERLYQTTVATFVTGHINATYFGHSSPSSMPATILTTGCDPPSGIAALLRLRRGSTLDDSANCPFSSLSAYYHNHTSGLTTYKLFSTTVPSTALLSELFTYVAYNKSIEWKAYPRFASREQFAPFVLPLAGGSGGGVYYVSSFESAVSCMECMAISAKNVALLVREEVERRRSGAVDGASGGGGGTISSSAGHSDSHTAGTSHSEL